MATDDKRCGTCILWVCEDRTIGMCIAPPDKCEHTETYTRDTEGTDCPTWAAKDEKA